jgi:hypothetical protein
VNQVAWEELQTLTLVEGKALAYHLLVFLVCHLVCLEEEVLVCLPVLILT